MRYLFLLFIISSLSIVSCRKCVTCSYTFPNGAMDSTIVYEEYCDKRSTIKLYERNIQALADSLGGVSNCE